MQSPVIDTQESLIQLCQEIEHLERIGLDTEFHAERRYQPELMLVQLAADDGRTWLIDPLRVDLMPLAPILESTTWVCHGSFHDIALLHRATGARPARIIDTQILAAFCHMRFPIGLAALTDRLLGSSISKCPALTDWSRRPLTEEQRQYAATDARVVLELVDRLTPRLQDPRYSDWVEQAGQDLVDRALAPPDPDRAWKTLEIASRLDDPTRRVLHHIHLWRETLAREKKQPPHFILSDGQALQISRNRPRNLEEMSTNRRMSSSLIQRHGTAILETIEHGLRDTSPAPVVASLPQCQSARLLRSWAEVIGPELGIAAELLLPWELALRVIRRPKLAWTGWRREATGESLQQFLSGKVQLQMGRQGPRLV